MFMCILWIFQRNVSLCCSVVQKRWSPRPPFSLPTCRTVCAVHTYVGEKVTIVTRYTCDHKCTCCYYHALIMVVVTIPTTLVGLCMYHAWLSTDPPRHTRESSGRLLRTPKTPSSPICGAIPHTHACADTCLPAHTHSTRMLGLCVYGGQIMAQCMQGLRKAGYSRTLSGWSRSCWVA